MFSVAVVGCVVVVSEFVAACAACALWSGGSSSNGNCVVALGVGLYSLSSSSSTKLSTYLPLLHYRKGMVRKCRNNFVGAMIIIAAVANSMHSAPIPHSI